MCCGASQTVFLSKQVPWTIVAGRRRDAQTIEVLGAYTILSITNNTPWGKEATAGLVLFLENMLPLQW